jgi:hypothetical protein
VNEVGSIKIFLNHLTKLISLGRGPTPRAGLIFCEAPSVDFIPQKIPGMQVKKETTFSTPT